MQSGCAENSSGEGIESGSVAPVARRRGERREYERVDPDLVRRAKEGCADAFAALYDRLAERVRRMALRIVRDEHEVEDVTQDTFLAAF